MKKVSILMENGEKILIDLFFNEVLGIVENFEKLVNEGFYNGVMFYCVIFGFVF